jgi:hypothetical protein
MDVFRGLTGMGLFSDFPSIPVKDRRFSQQRQ